MWKRALFLVVLAGCGGDKKVILDGAVERMPDRSVDVSSPVDTPVVDQAPDVARDMAPDSARDVALDVSVRDMTPDAGVDSSPDAAPDLPPDVAPDSSPDMAPDLPPDSPPDMFVCPAGFGDCDGVPSNGCETNLRASLVHCGRCHPNQSASESQLNDPGTYPGPPACRAWLNERCAATDAGPAIAECKI